MSDTLTRKQVLALSRALKRKGRKLPAVGKCVLLARIKGGPTARGRAAVCHGVEGGKHVYRKVGSDHSERFVKRRMHTYVAPGGSFASQFSTPNPFWVGGKRSRR